MSLDYIKVLENLLNASESNLSPVSPNQQGENRPARLSDTPHSFMSKNQQSGGCSFCCSEWSSGFPVRPSRIGPRRVRRGLFSCSEDSHQQQRDEAGSEQDGPHGAKPFSSPNSDRFISTVRAERTDWTIRFYRPETRNKNTNDKTTTRWNKWAFCWSGLVKVWILVWCRWVFLLGSPWMGLN